MRQGLTAKRPVVDVKILMMILLALVMLVPELVMLEVWLAFAAASVGGPGGIGTVLTSTLPEMHFFTAQPTTAGHFVCQQTSGGGLPSTGLTFCVLL